MWAVRCVVSSDEMLCQLTIMNAVHALELMSEALQLRGVKPPSLCDWILDITAFRCQLPQT